MTMRSEGTRGRQRRDALWTALLAAWLLLPASALVACGGRASGGSSGSETHWLQSCVSDSECGTLQCHCGICTAACSESDECVVPGAEAARCVERATLDAQCAPSAPRRLCAAATSGETDPRRDGGSSGEAMSDGGSSDEAMSDGGGGDNDVSDEIDAGGDPAPPPVSDAGMPLPDPELGAVCDGSDDARLVVGWDPGGPLPLEEYYFTPQGNQFVVIDGHCNFWQWTRGRLLSGTLDDATLLADYESSYYGQLAAYRDVSGSPCADAPTQWIWDPAGGLFYDGCDAGENSLPARDAVEGLFEQLLEFSLPSAGALEIGVLRNSVAELSEHEWPLVLDPTVLVAGAPADWDPWRIPAGPAAATLRALAPDDVGEPLRLNYDMGEEQAFVDVLIRDEIPPWVRSTLGVSGRLARALQAANLCLTPDSDTRTCASNAECCGNTLCCVDCGPNSGRCFTDPVPCDACVANGGAWSPATHECSEAACAADVNCVRDECPVCDLDHCVGCFALGECWAAGCSWDPAAGSCDNAQPEPEPCAIDASDPSVPGVTIHLEADKCSYAEGEGGAFRYTVILEQSLDFMTVGTTGCGLCGDAIETSTWASFRIANDSAVYCPECDVGCCPPAEAQETTLMAGMFTETVTWPGLQWQGPSDVGLEPAGEFPPGSYAATVTFTLPGWGEVTATLPIEVK